MALISITEKLDVIDKFNCLMKESVATDSIYIRTKETILQYLKESNISGNDKAQAITSVLASMSGAITSAAMQTALQWATNEKNFALEKLKLGKELDILDADKAIKDAQADKLYWDSIATQTETIRMMGTPLIVNNRVQSLAPEGKYWQDIQVGAKQEINLTKEAVILDSKLKESFAAIHKTVADTVVNFGAWSYSLSEGGITTKPSRVPQHDVVPLSDLQRIIAAEQAKGYSYNAWANAVTSSAGMLGTRMASDSTIGDNDPIMVKYGILLGKLSDVPSPTIPV